MNRLLLIFTLFCLIPPAKAQVMPTDQPGTFTVAEIEVTFTDPGLANSPITAKIFYPATSAGTGTPVASGQFPVVAFGHGFNLNYLDYLNLNEHLASWGYLVITPDVQNGFNVDHEEYARELAGCIVYLQSEGQNSSSLFHQAVGAESGVYGHSMGGGASYLVPSVFSGINAIAGLAAAETNPSAISALANYSGPFMVVSGSADNTADEAGNQQPMYNAATGDKIWTSLQGGGHCRFTDGTTICDLVSAPGSMSRAEVQRLSNRYTTAFFNYYLKNDNDALPFLCGDSLDTDELAGLVDPTSNLTACLVGRSIPEPTQSLQIWPNPASLSLRIAGARSVEVFDLSGQKIALPQKINGQELILDLQNLPAGIFLVRDPQSGKSSLFSRK